MGSHRRRIAASLPALLAVIALAACSSPAATGGPAATGVLPPATQAGQATAPTAAGEPCSHATAEDVAAVVGTLPVVVEERAGRGDCDYFLTAAKDEKVNVGVTVGPDGPPLFESTKALGEPVPLDLGDESYSIYNQSIGTLVMVRSGAAVLAVQVATSADATNQRAQAIRLAEAILAGL